MDKLGIARKKGMKMAKFGKSGKPAAVPNYGRRFEDGSRVPTRTGNAKPKRK